MCVCVCLTSYLVRIRCMAVTGLSVAVVCCQVLFNKCYTLCSTQHCLSPLPSLSSLSHVKQGLHATGSHCWLKHCTAARVKTRTTRPDNHPAKDTAQQLQLALRHKPAAAAPAAPTPPIKPLSAAAAYWRGLACRTSGSTPNRNTVSRRVTHNSACHAAWTQSNSIRTHKSAHISLCVG